MPISVPTSNTPSSPNTPAKRGWVRRNSYTSILKNSSKYDLKLMANTSATWFRDQMREIIKLRFNKYNFIKSGQAETVRRLEIGKMYFFEYVPKYSGIGTDIVPSELLPVWDRYPLVLPFSIVPNGFVGINLHYLPIKYRAILLDQLTNTAIIPQNRLKVSWRILQQFSRLRISEFAVHRYLLNHITSPFRLVKIDDYANAIMLPMSGWYGTNKGLINQFRAYNRGVGGAL